MLDERVDLANGFGVADQFTKRAAVLKLASQQFVFAFCLFECGDLIEGKDIDAQFSILVGQAFLPVISLVRDRLESLSYWE